MLFRQISKALIRILVVAVILLMAICFPSFNRIMMLVGSALWFTVCNTLPLPFYLRKLGKGFDPKEGILDCSLLIASSVLAIIGAVWAFLPQEMILSK